MAPYDAIYGRRCRSTIGLFEPGEARMLDMKLVRDALKKASMLHYETFLRYRDDLSQLEAEVKEITKKRNMYNLLSEQREGEVKNLQAELDTTQKEHADLMEQVKIFEVSDGKLCIATNGQNPQVQQKVDRVDQLRTEMDEVKAMVEEWKCKMDQLASENETARENLASAEVQLRAAMEKTEARSQKIENLQSQLGSVVAERDTLAEELKAAKSVAEITRADAKEMVAQYKADAEAAQDRLKVIADYVKCESQREALKELKEETRAFPNLLSRMTVGRFLCEDSHSNSDDEGGDNVEGVIESTVVESREGEVDDG
ncbi:uncharacterized protein [Nicotiana tomentosiformis]|uniref:uncharacterized protein n=1 Tax=Nicotiana tomentosiformis TaxID=4098 RepID=UPI00388C9E21